MASISKTIRPKRSNNATVSPVGTGLAAGRGTPTATGVDGGGTVLLTETFADSSFAARGWYSIISADRVASPAPSGMPGSLRFTWNTGQTLPSSGGMRHAITATDRIYIKYQQQTSANWVGSGQTAHPHLVMVLSDLDGAFDGLSDNNLAIYTEVNYQSGNRPQMKFQDSRYIDPASIGINPGEARATGGANGQQGYADSWDLYTDGSASHGWYNSRNLTGPVVQAPGDTAWHTVECEVILNTVVGGIGQLDGICRYWWDGVLVWERTNLIMRTGTRPTLRMNQFLFTPYIGSGSPVTQTLYIADLTVATSRTSGGTPPASAAITGTTTGAWYESEVVAGGKTLILTLTNDTWVAAGALFDAQRQNILNGITAASSPAAGWNNRRSGLAVTNVVRTSNTVVTITLGALATYSVAANETLTVTVPATALSGGNAVGALPTLTITEGAPATAAPRHMYFNSLEPGAGPVGTNPNYLMTDDFSRGDWYLVDYDTASATGGFLQVAGWGGNIYENPITPPGAIVGGGVGLHGRTYAATSGYMDGTPGGRNMAEHGFVGGISVDEAYFRIYFQCQPGYVGGHEKQFDFTRGFGTGQLVCLSYIMGSQVVNYISYLHQDDGVLSQPGNGWMSANQAAAVSPIVNGHWYFLEMHVRLNTPGTYNGLFEMWMDDCGVNGTSGPAVPTLRTRYTDVLYRSAGEAGVSLGGIWIENWANPGSTGEERYANIIVSRTGPIGFAPLP